jgi:hypothetical protein
VAFERRHRLWRYPFGGIAAPSSGAAASLPVPPDLGAAPANGGLEAMARLADGRLLLVTEDFQTDGGVRGWISAGIPGTGPRWAFAPLTYATTGLFRPTDFVGLPSGDVLALERRYTFVGGPAARVVRISAETISAGATISGEELMRLTLPATVDNFEGIAAAPDPGGGTTVIIVSDDNFRPLQRTLFLAFRLPGD